MKEKFSGYYRQKDLSEVINSNKVVIVLDSSVLCNLYGLHDDVWMPIIEMIGKKANALWMPYNLACDYHRGIIPTLRKKIQELVSLKNRLLQTTEMLKTLPFQIDENEDFANLSKELSKKLTREIALIRQRGRKDSDIREKLAKMYESKVGCSNNDPDPHSYNVSSYKDANRIDAISGKNTTSSASSTVDEQQVKSRNDIILHTLILLSKSKQKDVLYVYSEPSEYWSVLIDKTSFGPNPEHQSYFKKETVGHDFYCCTFSSFMNKLAESLDENLPDNVKRSLKKLSYGAMIQNDES